MIKKVKRPSRRADVEGDIEPVDASSILNNFDLESNVVEQLLESRTLHIDQEITDNFVSQITGMLDLLSKENKKPITLIVNTGGGDIYAGLALYDYIRKLSQSGIQMRMIATGKCMSMGVPIFLAGDSRRATPNCTFMLHEILVGVAGTLTRQKMLQEFKEQTRLLNVMVRLFSSRTKKRAKYWRDILFSIDNDWYFGINIAKKLGLLTK